MTPPTDGIDWILAVASDPEAAFRRVRGRADVMLARVLLAATGFSALLGYLVTTERFFDLAQILLLATLGWTALALFAHAKALWTYWSAAQVRAEGRVNELFFMLSLSLLPGLLILPFALIGRAIGAWFAALGWIAAACWSVALWGRAVRVHTRLSTAAALRIAFAPAFLYLVVGAAVAVFFLFALFRIGFVRG